MPQTVLLLLLLDSQLKVERISWLVTLAKKMTILPLFALKLTTVSKSLHSHTNSSRQLEDVQLLCPCRLAMPSLRLISLHLMMKILKKMLATQALISSRIRIPQFALSQNVIFWNLTAKLQMITLQWRWMPLPSKSLPMLTIYLATTTSIVLSVQMEIRITQGRAFPITSLGSLYQMFAKLLCLPNQPPPKTIQLFITLRVPQEAFQPLLPQLTSPTRRMKNVRSRNAPYWQQKGKEQHALQLSIQAPPSHKLWIVPLVLLHFKP